MSLFGLVSRQKHLELQNENVRLQKSLNEAQSDIKKLKARITELSKRVETLSIRNTELTNFFHSATKDRDQLQAKLEKYSEERLLLQKMIQDLDSLARKRRRKAESSSVGTDSFEADIERLLKRMSIEDQ